MVRYHYKSLDPEVTPIINFIDAENLLDAATKLYHQLQEVMDHLEEPNEGDIKDGRITLYSKVWEKRSPCFFVWNGQETGGLDLLSPTTTRSKCRSG